MIPAALELLAILKSKAFNDSDAAQCAKLTRDWQLRHHLDHDSLMALLTHFGAQILQAVRSAQMKPELASELLTRLFVLADVEVPQQLYALKETVSLFEEQKRLGELRDTRSGNVFLRQQMGRILATLPDHRRHAADLCRDAGRYGIYGKRSA